MSPLTANPITDAGVALATTATQSSSLANSSQALPSDAVAASVGPPTIADVARDSAILLSGSAAQWSASGENLPGGTRLVYPGTIVPESPGPGQITEDAFVQLVAAEAARRLPNAPGAGDATAQVEILEGGIAAIFDAMTSGGGRLESALRLVLGLPADLTDPVPIDVFVDKTVGVLPPAADLATMLSLGMAAENDASPDGTAPWPGVKPLLSGAGILWWPREGKRAGETPEPSQVNRMRWSQLVGDEVHSIIQAHYWLTHPSDILLFEDFIVCGAGFLTKVWDTGVWGSLGTLFPLIQVALKTSAGGLKRPDILNVSQQILYEIKPISGAATVPAQLAEYVNRLTAPNPTPALPNLRLGGSAPTDWRPYPLYYAGGLTVVLVELTQPGAIIYTRLMTPTPVISLFRAWRDQQRNKNTAASVAAVAMFALILIAAALVSAPAGPPGEVAAVGGVMSLATFLQGAMTLGLQPATN